MVRYSPLFLGVILALLMGGTMPSSLQKTSLQHELADLTKRGFTYRFLRNDLIELKDPLTGSAHIKSLQEQDETQIRAWATARGIPILEINPVLIDTSQYAGWYTFWTQVPLSNGIAGPLIVGDENRNGRAEVYGLFKDFGSGYLSRIYEIDSIGTVTFSYDYFPRLGYARQLLDSNSDSLKEISFTFGGSILDYEQPSPNALPTVLKFEHRTLQGDADPGFTRVYFGSLDGDSLTDFLYKGSEPDPVDTTIGITKIYVAEFNPDSNNFVRVWSTEFVPMSQSGIGGFAVDDFDRDGKTEFAVVDLLSGKVFIVENTGDNSYEQVWRDSTPFVNLYYETSGDVDGNGKPELFVGATMSNGNWTTVFESDSNDHYSPKFLFYLLSGGTFDEPTYMTSDVDNDGRLELIVFSGNDLYIFKSREDKAYYLWYLKREDRKDGVQFYDFNGDGRKDFIISKTASNGQSLRFYADIYKAAGPTTVQPTFDERFPIRLSANYPNPFNPETRIEYSVSHEQFITLKIYDITGKEVAALVNERKRPGSFKLSWSGAGFAGGVYFCRLQSEEGVLVRKMLLIH